MGHSIRTRRTRPRYPAQSLLQTRRTWAIASTDEQGDYPLLRNDGSGPEIGLPGRIFAGSEKLQNRPSDRPLTGRRADFDVFPTRIKRDFHPRSTIAHHKVNANRDLTARGNPMPGLGPSGLTSEYLRFTFYLSMNFMRFGDIHGPKAYKL